MLIDISVIYELITLILLGYYENDHFYKSGKLHFNSMICVSPKFFRVNKCNQSYIYHSTHEYNSKNYSVYHDDTYVVQPGDTLFYISWITGNSCLFLVKKNNIKDINVLKVGQILKVSTHDNKLFCYKKYIKIIFFPFIECNFIYTRVLLFIKKNILSIYENIKYFQNVGVLYTSIIPIKTLNELIIFNNWTWPAYGQVINNFSNSEGGSKGIDIFGVLDQPILATNSGKVMYVGNVLQGYGNLIVVKHNRNYLSAYAHVHQVLVIEKQKVKIGDRIATMGKSGTDQVKLHFEIRYKGKPVNPLYFLP